MATLFLRDIYQRYLRPNVTEKESMRVLHFSTLGFGVICIAAGLAMIEIKSALDVWWELAGIFGGGMLGLFLLGRIAPRAGNVAGIAGVVAGVIVILWMTLSPKLAWFPVAWRSPYHGLLVIVFGTASILIVGLIVAAFAPSRHKS